MAKQYTGQVTIQTSSGPGANRETAEPPDSHFTRGVFRRDPGLQRSGTGQESFLLSGMLILVRSLHTTCRGSVAYENGNMFTNAPHSFDSPANAFWACSRHRSGVLNTPSESFSELVTSKSRLRPTWR
jgi:hypothetical protein